MSFFSFLGNAAKTAGRDVLAVDKAVVKPVFNFLNRPSGTPFVNKVPLNQQVSNAKQFVAPIIHAAQTLPRGGAQLGTSIYDAAAPHLGLPQQMFDPKQLGPVGTAAFGEKPVQPVQADYAAARQAGHGIPFSAGVAGLALASDLPIGPGKFLHDIPLGPGQLLRLSDDELKGLAKATTPQDVKKIIGDAMPGNLANRVAPAIAHASDPNAIKNIFANELSPKPLYPHAQPPVEAPPVAPQEEALNQAQNKHLQTISNAQSTTPELRQAITGLKQTHDIRNTQQLSDQAKEAVDKDYSGSMAQVLSKDNLADKDIAIGEHLITRAQQNGKIGEAVNIAETLDRNLREHGRAVQAGSIISKLSPEGQLLYATKQIRKAREANPKNLIREKQTAQDIQNNIENSAPPIDRNTVHSVVKDIASGKAISADQQKFDLGGLEGPAQAVDNTGQALAKKVERAASPQIKKQADTLVQELTKKVKQEYLAPTVDVKRQPIDILRDVFGRNAEAKEAYPLAQQILRDKYQNVPQMSEALDKFFGSKLDLPAANTTINNAIRDQLKAKGTRVSDVIYKSLSSQDQTVENVSQDLVKEGFDKQSADSLAQEVAKRLNQQVVTAKQSALDRLGRDIPQKAHSTYLDKVNKFSNLGALEGKDYIDLARAKLDLPHLTPETAGKIHELSQKIQDLPEGHDKYAAMRQIQQLTSDSIPKHMRDLAIESTGLPRTIMASGDFSFGGRQGLVYATSHPVKFARAWPQQFEYFKQAFKGSDSEAYDAMMADIKTNKFYPDLEKYGRLLEPTGHTTAARSEQFLSSDLAEKIPLAGRLVKASNYAFTGLYNNLYANQFYGMLEHAQYGGLPLTEHSKEQLAEVIGTSLGRGGKKGGFTEKHSGFLMTGFFAPRLIASRLNVMNPAYYIRLDGPARQEALRGLLGLSAFAGGVLGLAKLAGADVGTDPRSANFGKIKVGDTRIDALGGFTQYIRLGTQLATGQKINSTTGAQTEVGKGLTGSRLDIASNFVQGKENPSVSFVTNMLKGKDINGNNLYTPQGVGSQVMQRFIPLLAQDINDLRSHPNAAGGNAIGKVATGVAGTFGAGIQTYGTQDEPITPKQQDYIKSLKGAPKEQVDADKSFFQFLKVASGKQQNTSEAINKALAQGDIDKAQSLADNYNQQLVKGMSPWATDQNLNYLDDTLAGELSKRQINLTDQTIKARLQGVLNNPKKYGLDPAKLKGVSL